MKKRKKIIGILGGMGPQASARMVSLLVAISAKKFKAVNCEDFPEIVLDSVPIPDFISSKRNKKIALEILSNRVKKLNKIGVSVLAISCNTAHLLLNQLQKVSKVPFISMVDEIAKEVHKSHIKKVGLLASPTTFKSGLFQQALARERLVWPERRVYVYY
ncbi:MAG: amino acid racemase [Candidatus Daviesbacteria bacterium]|nr:amino acid racemase [Candidatus Daviesbacteria bacterium]